MKKCYDRALAYAKQRPDNAYAIMAAHLGVTPYEFAESISDGISLISPAEQYEFLGPDGRLPKVVDICDRILRQTHLIKGPDRRSGTVTAAFAIPRTQ